MTREEAAKYAELLQAYADGKTLQWRVGSGKWTDADGVWHDWDCASELGWRIKPEPREFWVDTNRYGQDPHRAYPVLSKNEEWQQAMGWIKVREVIE